MLPGQLRGRRERDHRCIGGGGNGGNWGGGGGGGNGGGGNGGGYGYGGGNGGYRLKSVGRPAQHQRELDGQAGVESRQLGGGGSCSPT